MDSSPLSRIVTTTLLLSKPFKGSIEGRLNSDEVISVSIAAGTPIDIAFIGLAIGIEDGHERDQVFFGPL